jgi:hypothetical protein
MVGAGPLTSAIWKSGDERSGWRYHFNVFRQLATNGHVSQLFHPADLMHFVKLTRVLAAVIADDGCLTVTERTSLLRLVADLDDVLCRSAHDKAVTKAAVARGPKHAPLKGAHNGDSADS